MYFLKKTALSLLAVLVVVGSMFFLVPQVFYEDTQIGLQQDITLSAAKDCPIQLPSSASNIYYAYELYWQGGAAICRYTFPHGDILKQAETHLKISVAWKPISSSARPTTFQHQFMQHDWFQPAKINQGFESETTGVLWEPKVWIDSQHRYIYVISQN